MDKYEQLIEIFKDIQENYMKALERENEELRKMLESERMKIDELEKKIHDMIKNSVFDNIRKNNGGFDNDVWKKTIGPQDKWTYINTTDIWTTDKTLPTTYSSSEATAGMRYALTIC